jgi:hypothetical protein
MKLSESCSSGPLLNSIFKSRNLTIEESHLFKLTYVDEAKHACMHVSIVHKLLLDILSEVIALAKFNYWAIGSRGAFGVQQHLGR